jgi:hypothetical protein
LMLFLDEPEVVLKWMLLHVIVEVIICEFNIPCRPFAFGV